MGQLTSPAQIDSQVQRRHIEPPNLWIALFASSIVLHGLTFLGLRSWVGKATNLSTPAPISVEIVSIAPQTQTATRSARPLTSNATPADATAPGSVQQTDPTSVTATTERSLDRQLPNPQTAASRVRSRSKRSDSPSSRSGAAASNAGAARNAPSNHPGKVDNADNAGNPGRSGNQSENGDRNDPGLPSNPSGGAAGNPLGDPTQGGGMPTIPVTSQRGSGKGLSLVVTEVRNANGGRDLPDTPVQSAASTPNFLTPATKAFPDVVYPSEVSLNLKSKITVRVLIDRDGKPQTVDVLQGSQSEVYDREAKELLQTLLQEMSFVPAQQNGQPVDTLLDVDLSLAPL